MKHNLLRGAGFVFCLGLFSIQVNIGYAQSPKHYNEPKSKISADLLELKNTTSSARTLARRATSGPQKLNLLQLERGFVAIDAVATSPDGQELLRQLSGLGLKNGVAYKRIVSGFFPVERIAELEKISTLNTVAPAYKLQHAVGAVTSQGDAALQADEARQKTGLTGRGTKVGVISDTFGADSASMAAGIASGDIPADVQILADVDEGTDEGRGMAEIVHDVAPGAKIAFHTALGGQANFANGIQRLAQAGCQIIVDDISYLVEPMFQDGIIAQSIDEVVRKNVTYFSAAGNHNRQSYQAPFRNSGRSIVIGGVNYGVAHDFGNGDLTQTIRIPAGGSFIIPFQWDEPFYSVSGGTGSRSDLDVLVFYNGTLITDLSSMANNLGGDPIELVGISVSSAVNIEIMITKYAGPDPNIIKWVDFGEGIPQEHVTRSSTIYGHYNAQSTISVGATAWFNTPEFNTNLTRPVINSFSSAGGTPILISTTGTRLPFNENNIRRKPDVVGPDGGNTTFFGDDHATDPDNFPNFFGTSAAAPHVAAVAALMQELRKNSLIPAAIAENLRASTIDMDDPLTPGFDTGFDFQTGYGFVQATKVLETTRTFGCSLSLTTKVVQAQAGWRWPNGLGSIDLTVQGGTAPYTYRWNSGTATEDITKATPGLYTVTVTDATGCTATTTVNVGVTGSPLTLTSSHVNVSRYGAADGSIDLSVIGGVGPYTFKWNAGVGTEDLPWVTAGLYTVTVTDANGATAYTAIYVSANGEPLALQTAHNNASRGGADDGSIDLTVIGGVAPYKYKWNAGPASEDLARVTPGLYTVTVTDATGATATTSVYVSVKGQPLALQIAHIDASRWGADDGSINLTVIGGVAPYKYKWNAGSAMEDLPRVLPGLYTVTVTDATGATATASVQVGVRGTSTTLAARKGDIQAETQPKLDKPNTLTAYPNPANGRANITFALQQDTDYDLAVYDLKGSLVKKLKQGQAKAGQVVETVWEPQGTAKGIYLVRLKTQNDVRNLRLVID